MKIRGIMAAAVVAAAGAAHAAPLEAYGRLPTMSDVALSPDGSKIAFTQPVKGGQAVVVDRLSPASIIGEMPPTRQKVRALIWADSDHLLVIKSYTGYIEGIGSRLTEWALGSVDTYRSHKMVAARVTTAR